jgi:polysaccharide export outer membrane protein
MRLLFLTIGIVGGFILGGCGQVVQHGTPFAEVRALAADEQKRETVISPMDTIEIKFLSTPEMNETVTVPPNGRILLALMEHPIQAAGLTQQQLAGQIRNAYSKVISDAVVTVYVRTFANLRVFVSGEVLIPGAQAMSSSSTVVQAIAAAGGFKPTARTNEIVVIRHNDTTGKRIIFTVDLDKVISGEDGDQDIALQPLDTVFVPRSKAAEVANAIDQYFRQLLPISTTGNLGATYNMTPTAALTK